MVLHRYDAETMTMTRHRVRWRDYDDDV